jgi:hypothetical protein
VNGVSASQELAKLARDLHRMGPAGRRRLKKAFTDAGAPLQADARSRASWSSRIPGAISVRPLMSDVRGMVGVQLRVSAANAPHARPYEGMGQGGTFRHPVYGHDVWVPQATRPYAFPAVKATADKILPAIGDAYEAAARECGFR